MEKQESDCYFYECKCCDFVTKHKSSLEDHRFQHSEEKPLKCDLCDYSCITRRSMKTHKQRHSGKRSYHCCECKKSFYTQNHLSEHKKCVHDRKFKCTKCDYKAGTKHYLKIHSLIHKGEKPFVCKICGSRFRRKSHLNDHIKSHRGKRDYKCDKCHKGFVTHRSIRAHKKTHLSVKPHNCDLCDYSCIALESMKIHKLRHSGTKPYHCLKCEKRFYSRYDLVIHNRRAHNRKCVKCDYKVGSKECLERHAREKPFVCKECGARFRLKAALNSHAKWHGGKQDYKCDKCAYSTRNSSILKYHIANHLEASYRFKCDKCNYPAKSQLAIGRHMFKYHSNSPPSKSSQVLKQEKKASISNETRQNSSESDVDDPQTQPIRIKLETNSIYSDEVCEKLDIDVEYENNIVTGGFPIKLETNSLNSINEDQSTSIIDSSKENLPPCSIILTKLENMNNFSGFYYFRLKRTPNLYEVVRINL